MNTQLPLFEGRKPDGATLKLTGTADERIGSLAHGEEVFLVVRGRVSKVAHGEMAVKGDSLFVREHTVKASVVVLLDADDGERMLSEGQMLADERFGIQSLFRTDAGPDGETGELP